MDTDELIKALAAETGPVSPYAVERDLALAHVGGLAVCTLALALFLGIRPDLNAAVAGPAFWIKAGFTAALGAAGVVLSVQLARPDTLRLRMAWLPLVPVAMLMMLAIAELGRQGGSGVELLLAGSNWRCVPLILLLALPALAASFMSLRRMAPTRLRAAGAAAGLAAGGLAATLYSLSCQQMSPSFVFTRYGLAVCVVTAAGALLGPRLLRW